MALKLGGTKKAAPVKAAAKKLPAKKSAARPAYDDDDDAAPAARPRTVPKAGKAIGKGWDAGDAKKAMGAEGFTQNLRIKDGDEIPLKFIEDEPYAVLRVHWLQKAGRRSYICPETDDCPLCGVGAKTTFEARFNVAQFTSDDPLLKSLNSGSRLFSDLKALNAAKTGPLTKYFYVYARTGAGFNDTKYSMRLVRREDDLTEDYPEIYVPSPTEIADLGGYTKDDVEREMSPIEELEEVADGLAGGGYEDS